jgi:hypothetical protein
VGLGCNPLIGVRRAVPTSLKLSQDGLPRANTHPIEPEVGCPRLDTRYVELDVECPRSDIRLAEREGYCPRANTRLAELKLGQDGLPRVNMSLVNLAVEYQTRYSSAEEGHWNSLARQS